MKTKTPKISIPRKKVNFKTDKGSFKNLTKRLGEFGFGEVPAENIINLQKKGVVPNFENDRIKITADQTVFYAELQKIRIEISSTFNETLKKGKGAYTKKYGAIWVNILQISGIDELRKPLYQIKFYRGVDPRKMNDRIIDLCEMVWTVVLAIDSMAILKSDTLNEYDALKKFTRETFEPMKDQKSFDLGMITMIADRAGFRNEAIRDLFISFVRSRYYYWRTESESGKVKSVQHIEKKRVKYSRNNKLISEVRKQLKKKKKSKT